ncbi:MAG: hypothetical protein WCX31_01275 [Salinivirgaceae bacterium]|jgi:hypothetical protein
METSLIEQLDKSRYNLVKWLTIGWMVWYGTFISKDLINNKVVIGSLLIIGLIGWILFTINLIRFNRLGKKVKADRKLKEALNNEMHQLYAYKSIYWGFGSVMGTIAIFIAITSFHDLSALIVCKLLLFVGISTSLIANLAYNKS